MKSLLLVLTCLVTLTASADTIPLRDGQSAQVTLPDSWHRADPIQQSPGKAAVSTTVRYVTKNGSNDAILISFIPTPDDRLADPAALRAVVEQSVAHLIPGSVEGKANVEELRWAGVHGFAVSFTDAKLVGKPSRKGDHKTMTTCHLHLGPRLVATVTILTDDLQSPAYAEARRILQSLTLTEPTRKN